MIVCQDHILLDKLSDYVNGFKFCGTPLSITDINVLEVHAIIPNVILYYKAPPI